MCFELNFVCGIMAHVERITIIQFYHRYQYSSCVQDGREILEDLFHYGRPSTSSIHENITNVKEMVLGNVKAMIESSPFV